MLNKLYTKLFKPRDEKVFSGIHPAYAELGAPEYKAVDEQNLVVAREMQAKYFELLGFKSKDSEVRGDPYKFIFKIALFEHNFKDQHGVARSILMPVNLYERAQWLKRLSGTKSHKPGEEKYYAREIAEILELAIKKWGPPHSNEILDLARVKEDLEMMSYERKANIHFEQLKDDPENRFNVAKKFIENFYTNDSVKLEEERARLRGLRKGKDPYSMADIDALNLCGDTTGTAWRAYTGVKPNF